MYIEKTFNYRRRRGEGGLC